jgi:glucose-1-phosphatase
VIRTLIFDLGNVLIPFEWKRGYAAFAQASPYSAEEIRLRIKEEGLFDGFERGKIEPRDVAQRLTTALKLNVTFEEFQEIWSSIFLPETILSDELLSRLHANHRVLLLSNTDPIHFRWVRARYPLLRHFDDFVLSFDLGLRKPELAIYQDAIARAGCKPAEIFFADDRPENIEGAIQAGIDAVQFTSPEQLERDLKSRGVNW